MLTGPYQSVLEAHDLQAFKQEIVRFAHGLNFQTASATLVIDHPFDTPEFHTVTNAPSAFQDTLNNRDQGKKDPVMQHCKRHSHPMAWDQHTYVQAGAGEMWEDQARFGYRSGIIVAMHLPHGRHFVLGLDSDQGLPRQSERMKQLFAELQLFTVYAHSTAERLLDVRPFENAQPRLTPRELECLHWTMEGKTAWEVGCILGITERTAVLHLNNAMHKLDCHNKHQAVLKALRQGLLH